MRKVALSITTIISGIFFALPLIANAEIVRSFTSNIIVFEDSSLIVKEGIIYDFENSLRHGINRDIPLVNKDRKRIDIEVLSVTDKDNNPYTFSTSIKNKFLNIKIGDSGVIISGEKTYNIAYRVIGAIDYYDDFDEIYWNATGNDWNVPIEFSEVSVTLPKDVFPKEKKCYEGVIGSKDPCKIFDDKTFRVEKTLNKGEGVTIAVSFKKGSVLKHDNKTESSILDIIKFFWPILIPMIVFGLMFTRWFKKGRDTKRRGIIKPEYSAPKDLSPIEAGGILHETIKPRSISAQIIDLAIRGYIKIKFIEEKKLGNNYNQDYEMVLLKEIGYLENNFDKEILLSIFGDRPTVGGKTTLSSLHNLFYKSVSKISKPVIESLLKKKYYFNFPVNIMGQTALIVISIFFTFSSLAFWIWSSVDFQDSKKLAIYFSSMIISVCLAVVFNFLMPSKTEKGVLAKEHLLGLKEYIEIAEKDRLVFHNAPKKRPEIFEALLPYAIVFGVEELWAKEFGEIYNSKPEWFESNNTDFRVSDFGKELFLFNTVLTLSISSNPSSSSSSGVSGGSSGGGSGGGGGGSW